MQAGPWEPLSMHTGIFKGIGFCFNSCICENVCHVCAVALEGQKRVSVPLELELHMVVCWFPAAQP